jgi:aspartyl-tRNA(Asn)/glutamyl-tRNA(Gln) amidotransferase subunit B
MAEPYKIVIGLEVHVQLLTETKLFCGCRNQFGLPPNTATCPVCLGLPGSLPGHERAGVQARAAGGAGAQLPDRPPPDQAPGFTKWDRKNYYYPDLPRTTRSPVRPPVQPRRVARDQRRQRPEEELRGKKVGIIRAHLEEDAGKNLHDESGKGGDTLVDLNRTGTPLLEIVSAPDMTSPEEAIAYLEEIRLMLREIGVSDCEMQEGSLRCDANVNIHVP